MQLVIEILNKVKAEHETFLLETAQDIITCKNVKPHYPIWLNNKRIKSEQILKETNEAIALISAYKLTKNQIENQITKQDGN